MYKGLPTMKHCDAKCRRAINQGNAQGLLALNHGDAGVIKLIDAGKRAVRRLYEMGFTIGTPIKIVKNDAGPVIVSLAGNKVALGRGIAAKIQLDKLA